MKHRENYINIVSTAWKKTSCEKLITFLEGLNFRFVEHDLISQSLSLPNTPAPHYKYMVRMRHIDKDPKKDIYDFNLVWAIDIEDQSRLIYTWLFYKKYKLGKKSWDKSKQVNFKPKKIGTKYPDWMSIQDRIDYRRIEKKMVNRGITKEEEIFFNRCYPAVKEINDGVINK